MPVLISLGNGYLKMIDDGRPPEDPSGYRFLDVKSAPMEVKQEIMGEISQLKGIVMQTGTEVPSSPPSMGKRSAGTRPTESDMMKYAQGERPPGPIEGQRLMSRLNGQGQPTMGEMAASVKDAKAPKVQGPKDSPERQAGMVRAEDGSWVPPSFFGPPSPQMPEDYGMPPGPNMGPPPISGSGPMPGSSTIPGPQMPGMPPAAHPDQKLWDEWYENMGPQEFEAGQQGPSPYMRRGYNG